MDVTWDEKTGVAGLYSKVADPKVEEPKVVEKPKEVVPKVEPPKTESKATEPKPADVQEMAKTPVMIGKVEPKFNILPANSIGTIYVEAVYTNNSEYTLESYSISYRDKSTGEKNYISSYQVVKPGETSKVFDGFGPESGKLEDMELLETDYTITKKGGEVIYVDFNHKTRKYDVLNWD